MAFFILVAIQLTVVVLAFVFQSRGYRIALGIISTLMIFPVLVTFKEKDLIYHGVVLTNLIILGYLKAFRVF